MFFIKQQQIFSFCQIRRRMANWDVILFPLNSNCTYFLDRITSNNFCVLQWCNLSAQHNETWLILAIWDKPCMFRQNITWWIGSISYKNKLSLTICFTQQQQKLPFTRNPVELCEFEDLKESFQGANLLLDLQITAYSWVNENWAFLAENYVILEYFLTRNM